MLTDEPAFGTYEHVADGTLRRGPTRLRMSMFRKPWLLGSFVAFWLVFGIGSSLVTYEESFSYYPRRVIWIGVFWGAEFALGSGLLIALMLALMARHERRSLARLFAAGTVTTVTVDERGLEITRPARSRVLSYADLCSVTRAGSFLVLACRRRPRAELLPEDMLPDTLVEYVTARAQGVWPVSTPEPQGENVRRFVVPSGWASHIAGVYARELLSKRRVWIRFGLLQLVVVALAIWVDPVVVVFVPVLVALLLFAAYFPTRHNAGLAVPAGSVATTEFLEDRFVSRNLGGAREIRYADVRSVDVRRDVVLVRLGTGPVRLMARSLFPDDVLERLRAGA